eukprot:TRINITY_DN5317_c0_g1_i1.p1 TRINITY_DN5317_c0_g1~~TRINITY_DN5317_c0_g1_i1.p1  ORF type:complete len:766 (-),score=160.32 TRINITY_DN5317_c0_g1_i1:59-2356(-)
MESSNGEITLSVRKKGIAVLTSGGDAQGMNAAVRAVVRAALSAGANVYGVMNGYQGIVEDNIKQLGFFDVSRILHEGGTFIGTARCAAFMTREGRKQASLNLLRRGIDRLVIIGGDGSLTGANKLYTEWREFVSEFITEKVHQTGTDPRDSKLTEEYLRHHEMLTVVGLVGSIDNDMPGTDMTIGADTALNRIINAVDALMSTAASHQREFIVEVMGRNCGWLALMSALATGADWIIIPENPMGEGWEEQMCSTITKGKKMGRRSSIVIIAEGARDINGAHISSEHVKKALDSAGFDSRITILGHVQRGGAPTAWDRNSSTLQGVHAVDIALSDNRGEPCVVGIISNKLNVTPLKDCLATVAAITKAIQSRDFQQAIALRGSQFKEAHQVLSNLTQVKPSKVTSDKKRLRIGVMHAGACSPGMNTAVRAITRLSINYGHTILAIRNSFDGLLKGDVEEFNWMSVNGWAKEGGARLGTKRCSIKMDMKLVASKLESLGIDALVVIGGWDGYETILHMNKHKDEIPYLKKLPIVLIPASISNNLPGTDYTIGDDTAVNNIIECVDKIKQSAVSSSRVFVVEVMGSNGYLAIMSALATGADKVYIPEEKLTLEMLQKDIDSFVDRSKLSEHASLVINNEGSSNVFTTNTLAALFEDQSDGLYAVRTATLGHMQQGGAPSGIDRTFAATLAFKAIQYLEDEFSKEKSSGHVPESGCVGMQGGQFKTTGLAEMSQQMDMKHRRPKDQWWLGQRQVLNVVTYNPDLFGRCT